MTVLNAAQRRDTIRTMRQMLDRFERNDAELAALLEADRPDGYPTGTTGGGTSDVSLTSVESAAARRIAGDRHPTGAIAAFDLLWKAYRALEKADSARANALPPITAKVVDGDDRWCTSCARAEVCSPRAGDRGELCRWCADWRDANGQLPLVGLVERRAQGVRITSKVIAEVERAEQAGRRRKKARAR